MSKKPTRTAPAKSALKNYGTHIPVRLPADWYRELKSELSQDYFQQLQRFVAEDRQQHTVYPPEDDVFNAFCETPLADVKVVLFGQDPYHGPGQAHGMCFSVRPGVKPPPSLRNMLKELHDDLGCKVPNHGNLQSWSQQGVLLLNAVLTVREASPNSHQGRGWEQFTDAVIEALNRRATPVVYLLWGAYAQKKGKLIDETRHVVIRSAHPSPLSAKKFFGTRPYSQVNAALGKFGRQPVDWQVPDLV